MNDSRYRHGWPLKFLLVLLPLFWPVHSSAEDDAPAANAAVTTATESRCTTLFAPDDPRLFDFVETRRAVDYSRYQGQHIRTIQYITLPIFNENDPDEDNWLYRGVNWLHVPTRKSPIERQVLLHEGDPLDKEKLEESERILRDADYLYDAMILPAAECPDGLDLLVVVRDVWTLQLTGSVSRKGGDDSRSIGIAEKNLLGHGHGVYLSWDADPERQGIAAGFTSAHLLDGHTRLTVEHKENDDGTANNFVVERPFYAIDTPWSVGAGYTQDNLREKIKTADVTSNEYDHHKEDASLRVGMLTKLLNNRVHRFSVGLTSKRNNYSDQQPEYVGEPLPDDRTLAYGWLQFENTEYDYWTTFNLNQLFRNEDVNLGLRYRVQLGATSTELGSTERGLVSDLSFEKATSVGDHHVLLNRLLASLFYDQTENHLAHSRWEIGTTYDHFIDDRNRWHVDLIYQEGTRLDPEETYTAGGTVLRGFENATQRGDRFARINVERRHFYDIHPFHLFRVGSALFLEAGRAWDKANRFDQGHSVLYDLGVGLRLSSSKSRPGNVIHVNLAVPLNERDSTDKYLLSFYADVSF